MTTRRTGPRRRDERGAATVLFAALSVLLLGFAALGVDIAQQVSSKQLLIGQLDAASTAAASQLGNGGGTAGAVDAASTFFANNGTGELDLHEVDFWCVVARKLNGDGTPLNPAMVADLQIPTSTRSGGVCNPDAATATTTWRQQDYQNRVRAWDGRTFSMSCNAKLCAVPCALNAQPTNIWAPGTSIANNRPITCNTVRIGAERDVPFSFAPVLGVEEGSTGSQISVACAGSCGAVAPNPMDVVVVADRTLSMAANRVDLVDGIKSMLQVMTPEQQYVALGAIGPSLRTRANSEGLECDATEQGLIYASSNPSTATSGSWVPIPFKSDYLSSPDSSGRRALNPTSELVEAVNCLSSTAGDGSLGRTGTALAAPMKAAVRYLLNKPGDENSLTGSGANGRSGTIRKVLIFETDGQPQEPSPTTTTPITLDTKDEISSRFTDSSASPTRTTNSTSGAVTGRPAGTAAPSGCTDSGSRGCEHRTVRVTTTNDTTRTWTGGQRACDNLARVAELAKEQGVLVITIGYSLGGALCGDGNNGSGGIPRSSDETDVDGSYISAVSPNTSACRSGSGTRSNPYVPRSGCSSRMTVTWTQPATRTIIRQVQGPGDALVTDVLAGASGGTDLPAGAASGCSTPEQTTDENADDDLFFCAARGDDLAPLFVTALSKVSSGVKLIKLP